MKILVLSDLYPPYYKGGHEIQCKTIADGLLGKGHEIYVLTSNYGVNGKSAENNIFRSLNYLSIDRLNGFAERVKQVKNALLARHNRFITDTIIKKIKPDIVYAGQLTSISIYPMKAIQKYNIPIVHHLGNYYFAELMEDCVLESNPIKRFYRKILFGFGGLDDFDFKHIITVSKAVKQTYVKKGFSENNISVIFPRGIMSGLILEEGKKLSGSDKGQIRLLYIGRIDKSKGIHIAVEAVGSLINSPEKRELTLDIIGEGEESYKDELKTLIRKLKLDGIVRFKGHIKYALILKEYQNCDILLVPSIWEEPFGIILLEAMSQGLPVIASRTGGIPEIIEDGTSGLLVPPNDSEKLTEAIIKLIDNPSLYEEISTKGIKEIRAKYTYEHIINQIDDYLTDVLDRSSSISD
jgi:glycosyltransferase involved in cell wall biosynthesis